MFSGQNTVKKRTARATETGHGSQNRMIWPRFEWFYKNKEVFKVNHAKRTLYVPKSAVKYINNSKNKLNNKISWQN